MLIDICYNISVVGGSSTLAATTPSFVSNNQLLGASGACTATAATSTFANRPLVTFAGQAAAFGAGTYTWTWNPGALSGNVAVANPTASTNFTVTAYDPTTTCSNTATVNVNVNPTPVAPTAFNGAHCGNQTPTCYVTRSAAGTTFKWYTVPTGGTAIAGQNDSILVAYPRNQSDVFYVAEVYSTVACEGTTRNDYRNTDSC